MLHPHRWPAPAQPWGPLVGEVAEPGGGGARKALSFVPFPMNCETCVAGACFGDHAVAGKNSGHGHRGS